MGRRGGKKNRPKDRVGGGSGAAGSSTTTATSRPPQEATTNKGGEEGGEGTTVVPTAGRSQDLSHKSRTHGGAYHPGAGIDRLMVVAGTYDGVLVGWDTDRRSDEKDEGTDRDDNGGGGPRLQMTFAVSDAHEGSVRSLSISGRNAPTSKALPGLLVSAGYDEFLRCYDLKLNREIGEGRTPPDLGTPLCTAFAPPTNTPTHCLVGLTSGKIIIYSVKDWSVVHVLSGHPSPGAGHGAGGRGGVTALACHPSGKLALSGGTDGTVRLWDLTRGRLAYVHRITSTSPSPKEGGTGEATRPQSRAAKGGRPAEVSCIAFSPEDGSTFAFSHGKKVTARDTLSGETLLDVELPSRINDMCFIRQQQQSQLNEGSEEGGGGGQSFIACACDDGSLPVLAVGVHDEDEGEGAIRAVMAIEPVDGESSAGDERFKCIESVGGGGDGCMVVTANSGGIVSVVDLSGAARMMTGKEAPDDGGGAGEAEESSSGDDDDDDDDDEEEAAAEIIESVRVGSGARITDLAVWSCCVHGMHDHDEDDDDEESDQELVGDDAVDATGDAHSKSDRRSKGGKNVVELDSEAVARARRLVEQAKKKQRRHKEKREKRKENDDAKAQRQQRQGHDGRSEEKKAKKQRRNK